MTGARRPFGALLVRWRRIGIAIFLGGLVALQGMAFVAQFLTGFRPFGTPPQRIPFSWDMFAPKIDRCGLEWDPPLVLGDGVARLHDVAQVVEWDPVFDSREDYLEAARVACFFALPKTQVTVRCFTQEGEVVDAFLCH